MHGRDETDRWELRALLKNETKFEPIRHALKRHLSSGVRVRLLGPVDNGQRRLLTVRGPRTRLPQLSHIQGTCASGISAPARDHILAGHTVLNMVAPLSVRYECCIREHARAR